MIFRQLVLKVEPGGNGRVNTSENEKGYVRCPFFSSSESNPNELANEDRINPVGLPVRPKD